MKKMNLVNYSLLVLLSFALLIGCFDGQDIPVIQKAVTAESIPVEVKPVDDPIETPLVICEPVIEIKNGEKAMIKAITEYQNYYVTGQDDNKKLYGLDEQGKKEITVIDVDDVDQKVKDFFTKSGCSYFTILNNKNTTKVVDEVEVETTIFVETYFKQDGEKVSQIDTLPSRPPVSRVVFSNDDYSIENFDYKGDPYTDVRNLKMKSGIERMAMVDGYAVFENGLYFNVKEGRGTVRTPGLYLWRLDRMGVDKAGEVGEIW